MLKKSERTVSISGWKNDGEIFRYHLIWKLNHFNFWKGTKEQLLFTFFINNPERKLLHLASSERCCHNTTNKSDTEQDKNNIFYNFLKMFSKSFIYFNLWKFLS